MKHFFILYDGIENSVFTSQVVAPLEKQQKPTTIISFESHPQQARTALPKVAPHITIQIFPKIPFIGTLSLRFAAYHLKKFLSPESEYSLTTRGPLAGWIALHALDNNRCRSVLVQARGLVADEHRYTHQHNNLVMRLMHRIRAWQYWQIERAVFSHQSTEYQYHIEAVSNALKNHLVKTFDARANIITIAQIDIPEQLSKEVVAQFRSAVRTELSFSPSAQVYCYNGSAKSWQCPEEVITFFVEEMRKNQNAYLLLLSQDQKVFENLCSKHAIPKERYRIITTSHQHVMRYLAACDTGLLFRKPDIINWVSRPTKVLEYHAAHLAIKHNETVAWVVNQEYTLR